MDHGERTLEGGVKGLDGGVPLLLGTVLDNGLAILDIDVAKMVQDVLVNNAGSVLEFTIGKGLVDVLSSGVELVQNPLLSESHADDGFLKGNEILGQFAENILGRLPDLVAEFPPSGHDLDVEVDITARRGEGGHGEAQSIGTVAGQALWEGRLLVLLRLLDLTGVQIADTELGVEVRQRDAGDGV